MIKNLEIHIDRLGMKAIINQTIDIIQMSRKLNKVRVYSERQNLKWLYTENTADKEGVYSDHASRIFKITIFWDLTTCRRWQKMEGPGSFETFMSIPKLHGLTSQKTIIFTFGAMRTPNRM
jgi:hypothetical protein